MPKTPNPIPPIVGLVSIHELYRLTTGVPKNLSDSDYNDKLSEKLILDKVFEKKNQNFISAFRSRPGEGDWENAPGIDTKHLDKITLKVIDSFGFRAIFNLPDVIEFPWNVYCEQIVPTPDYLKYLDVKRYYKYLTIEEKDSVDNYIERRFNELGVVKNNYINYAAYMWNTDSLATRCAIFMIDPLERRAHYTYFAPADGQWVVKSMMHSIEFYIGEASSVIWIELKEEDPRKASIRANLILSNLDARFTNLSIIKGTINVTGHNATVPVACEIILEKCTSYFEAYNKVINDSEKNKLLCLEVQNKRIEVGESNIFNPSRLRSYGLYNVLEEVKGFYHYGFINQKGTKIPEGNLSTGVCHIASDGTVFMQAVPAVNPAKAYIDQGIFRGVNHLSINYFLSDPHNGFDFGYRLKIQRIFPENVVSHLIGYYHGIINSVVYVGLLVLFKMPDDFKNFQEAWASAKPRTIDPKEFKGLRGTEKKILTILNDVGTQTYIT